MRFLKTLILIGKLHKKQPSEENASKNNVHETICCFCTNAACKKEHSRNVCIECIEEKLI